MNEQLQQAKDDVCKALDRLDTELQPYQEIAGELFRDKALEEMGASERLRLAHLILKIERNANS